MVSIKDFAIPQGWQHISWNPDPPGKEYFVDGGTLLIGIANEERAECHVAWLDTEGRRWSIRGLRLVDGRLAGMTDAINEATQQSYRRFVDIWLDMRPDKTVITGKLEIRESGGVDGPVGTFTAEAHPRLGEEHIAV
jgi:hypothetical protein